MTNHGAWRGLHKGTTGLGSAIVAGLPASLVGGVRRGRPRRRRCWLRVVVVGKPSVVVAHGRPVCWSTMCALAVLVLLSLLRLASMWASSSLVLREWSLCLELLCLRLFRPAWVSSLGRLRHLQ